MAIPSISQLIKTARNGRSQAEFARELGVKQSTLSRYEKGDANPKAHVIERCMRLVHWGNENHIPTVDELARITEMYVWNEGRPVATLHPEAKIERIEELFPYLVEPNYKILVNKPIMMYMIHMSVLSIGFILLFFGYQYMKDPPQGAYIEKIMFLFLVFCSMEILHAWSAVKALEWQTFASVMGAGQYASLGVLLLIALFFALRLRFITSANGEFYEQELATSPSGITRWRDTLDNMVIDSFFNRRALVGRLFVPAGRRGQRLSPKSK